MILPITLTIAAAAALINFWLAVRVSQVRLAGKVMHGDGGNTLLMKRMRAQANFVEYTPFVVILIGLVEAARGANTLLWVAGIAYVLARIAHGFGMDSDKPNPFRAGGILVSMLVMLGLALDALWVVYTAPVLAPR